MIKVVVRHCMWDEPEEIGEYSPKEVQDVVNLIRQNGVYASENNDLEKFVYTDSYYNVDMKHFEIIVE